MYCTQVLADQDVAIFYSSRLPDVIQYDKVSLAFPFLPYFLSSFSLFLGATTTACFGLYCTRVCASVSSVLWAAVLCVSVCLRAVLCAVHWSTVLVPYCSTFSTVGYTENDVF